MELILATINSPNFIWGLFIGAIIFFPIGWFTSWKVRTYRVNNGFLLTPKKGRNYSKAIFTFILLVLFVINVVLYWSMNIEIPGILQFLAGLAATQVLNVNVAQPLFGKLLQTVASKNTIK